MRPSTPLSVSTHVGPSSPPQTPTAASYPPFSRKDTTVSPGPGAGSGGYTPPNPPTSLSQPPTCNLMSLGNGQFNLPFSVRPEDLSPRSFDPPAEGSEPETDSSDDESPSCSPLPTPGHYAASPGVYQTVVGKDNLTIEELSDFDEDDMEGRDDVIRPDAIEYADSERSLSQPHIPLNDPHIDKCVINDFRDLNVRSPGREPSSDESDLSDDEHSRMLQQMRAENRRKRQSMSSTIKRTMSERSDSDHEDVRHCLSFDDVGSSARRLKRRIGENRRSLIFQDPPPRIDEMDELPEELEDIEMLAKELPFYAYTSMEVDSPRSEDCWDQDN